MLKNRRQAALSLANLLKSYERQRPLILALPPGAVAMGKIIADELNSPLDILLVHKLAHPQDPENTIGAVDEEGQVYLAKNIRFEEIPIRYLESERQKQWHLLKKRRELYASLCASDDPHDRTVIIVDDGVASGWTIKAAIQIIKERKPAHIIVALTASSSELIKELQNLVSEVICLITADNIGAVGDFYEEFNQLRDNDAINFLSAHICI